MSVVVVATIFPLPGEQAAVIDAFRQIIPAVHAEDGCELYALHSAGETLLMVERWTSRETLAAHSTGAPLTALGPLLEGKLAQPAVVVVSDPIPAGDADKGVVR